MTRTFSDNTAFDDPLTDVSDRCKSQVTDLQNRLAAIERQQQQKTANSSITCKKGGERWLVHDLFTKGCNRSHEELRENERRFRLIQSEINVTTRRVSKLARLLNASASATEEQMQTWTEKFGRYVEQSKINTTNAAREIEDKFERLNNKISKNSVSLFAKKANSGY